MPDIAKQARPPGDLPRRYIVARLDTAGRERAFWTPAHGECRRWEQEP